MIIGNIIEGHVNELLGLNENISEKRLTICKICPIYSPKLGGICNNKLYFNPDNNDVSTKKLDGYIKGCGCRLKAKTTLNYESCPAGKW